MKEAAGNENCSSIPGDILIFTKIQVFESYNRKTEQWTYPGGLKQELYYDSW